MARIRFNGHWGSFNTANYRYHDSALSMHIYDNFDRKLGNFDFDFAKCIKPKKWKIIIYLSKADTISLNRYKAVQ